MGKFATSNISSPSYSLCNIEKFNGVDYTDTPTLVDRSRAIDISNYLPNGNGLVKRNGFETVFSSLYNNNNLKILNVWKYKNEYILFYDWNKKKYFCSHEYITEFNPTILYSEESNLTNSWAIEYEGKMFILALNKYFVYDGTTFKEVKEDAYIPHIVNNLKYDSFKYINLTDTHIDPSVEYSLDEDINLLNSSVAYISVILPKNPYNPQEVSGEYEETREALFYYDIAKFTSEDWNLLEVYDSNYKIITLENGGYGRNSIVRIEKKSDNKLEVWPSSSANFNEIIIKVSWTNNYSDNIIGKCKFGLSYGINGNQDVLFVSGNEDTPNIDYYTTNKIRQNEELYKTYTYFPANNFRSFGSSDSEITGYGIMNNGYMAIFKNKSKNNSTNLYFSYCDTNITTDEYGYTQINITFPIIISGLSIDCEKPNQIIQYGNYLLVNNSKGVYQINTGENTATQTYIAKEMSYMIRNELGSNIDNSVWCIYDNKLYIARENKEGKMRIFVCDSDRYTFKDSDLTFEWWVLDDINPVFMKVIDGKMYFFIENIGLCKLGDGYSDSYNYYPPKITVNDEEVNTEISYNDGYLAINKTSFIFEKLNNSKDKLSYFNNFKKSIFYEVNNSFFYDYLFAVRLDNLKDENYNDEALIYVDKDGKVYKTSEIENVVSSLSNQDIKIYFLNGYKGIYIQDFTSDKFIIIGNKRYRISFKGAVEEEYVYNSNEYITIYLNNQPYILNTEGIYFQASKGKIKELYCYVDNCYYPLSKCSYESGYWYYLGENLDDFTLLGNDNITFNYLKLYAYDETLDSYFLGSKLDIWFNINLPVESYFYGKYDDLDNLGYLKTANNITFVPDTKIGGFTTIGYKTSKSSVDYNSFRKSKFDFNEIDFNKFSFGNSEFGKSYSSKKKIKNFSFMQLVFYSNDENASSIVSIAFRYKVTKINKGVK